MPQQLIELGELLGSATTAKDKINSNFAELYAAGSGTEQIVKVTGDYTQDVDDDVIFCEGTFTLTLIDPATATKKVAIRNISGTTTVATEGGTSEAAILTTGQSVLLAPDTTVWRVI